MVFFESAAVLKEFVAHKIMADLKGFVKVMTEETSDAEKTALINQVRFVVVIGLYNTVRVMIPRALRGVGRDKRKHRPVDARIRTWN